MRRVSFLLCRWEKLDTIYIYTYIYIYIGIPMGKVQVGGNAEYKGERRER